MSFPGTAPSGTEELCFVLGNSYLQEVDVASSESAYDPPVTELLSSLPFVHPASSPTEEPWPVAELLQAPGNLPL